ncbi:MAG: hypothetical protein M3O31_15070 [Acidobacteriota bacterium]|nr:hypothetical protein [Acidobacteriota bacterium]
MKTANEDLETVAPVERRRPAYDPNNLSPEDEEAKKYDDNSDGIDWEEILASTQDDFEAGRFSYNSADYATQEEADAALRAWFYAIAEEVERELASIPPHNAAD